MSKSKRACKDSPNQESSHNDSSNSVSMPLVIPRALPPQDYGRTNGVPIPSPSAWMISL